jgi:hypothetical protein
VVPGASQDAVAKTRISSLAENQILAVSALVTHPVYWIKKIILRSKGESVDG